MLLTQLSTQLKRDHPQLKTQKLLLGVSGGLDSTVLTHLMASLGYTIGLAHCNFKLRGLEADQDAAFVKDLASHYGVDFFYTEFDTEQVATQEKLSIQMAARQLRYDWFHQLKTTHHFDFILTAHHADDNVETFLINLLRGTGLNGLTGIPAKTKQILRPLLTYSRDQIKAYALKNNIAWREDQSNSALYYLRNKLRHEVVPKLKEIEPNLVKKIEETSQYLSESRQIIDQAMSNFKKEVVVQEKNHWLIRLEPLEHYHPPKAYLYEFLKPFGFTAWTDINHLLQAQPGKQVFSSSHVLLKDRTVLQLSAIPDQPNNSYEITLDDTLETPSFKLRISRSNETEFSGKQNEVLLDADSVKFPLVLRKWIDGDYFYPLGLGGKKKISHYFRDKKFSLRQKEAAWILCDQEGAIIWLVNERIDQRVAISKATKSTVKIVFDPY